METRLAFVRRMTDNLQSMQLAKLEQTGQLNKLSPTPLSVSEIQQGDNDETRSNIHLALNHVSFVSSFDVSPLEQENTVDNHTNLSATSDYSDVIVLNDKKSETDYVKTAHAMVDESVHTTQQLSASSDTMGMRRPSWGVQVGAFSQKSAAQKQAEKAYTIVKGADKFVKVTKNDKFYRSRIYGFKTKKDANMACRRLKSKKMNCMTLQPISL